jgi:hypothetical protein
MANNLLLSGIFPISTNFSLQNPDFTDFLIQKLSNMGNNIFGKISPFF